MLRFRNTNARENVLCSRQGRRPVRETRSCAQLNGSLGITDSGGAKESITKIEVLKGPAPRRLRVFQNPFQLEVLVALNRNAERVERMAQTLAQRFDKCFLARPTSKERRGALVRIHLF